MFVVIKVKGEKSDSLRREIKLDKHGSYRRLIMPFPMLEILTLRVLLNFIGATALSQKRLKDERVLFHLRSYMKK